MRSKIYFVWVVVMVGCFLPFGLFAKDENANKFCMKLQLNTECKVYFGNEFKGTIKASELKIFYLPVSTIKITAQPTNNEFKPLSTNFEITTSMVNKSNVVTLELARKVDLKSNTEQEEDNWFMRVVNNLVDKHKLTW